MMPVFDPLRLGTTSLDVLASAHTTALALAVRQRERLEALLLTARRDSPFYREHLRGVVPGVTPLGLLPPVTRQELMARFDDWVTDPRLTLAGLQTFTADAQRVGEPYLGQYLVWESSGTSHQPGIFVQDARAMAVYDALEMLRCHSPRPTQRWLDPMMLTERIAFVGVISGHFASFVTMQRLQQLNPWMPSPVRCFSIMQSTQTLVDELNAFAPTVIATYPTVAAVLADEANHGALRFAPQEVWTGGETLSATVRRCVTRALGCTVRNSYGASEFLSIAWECGHGQLHVNADWVILEPVDERGRPVPPGVLSYSTLLTNLANHVQPLIRYDLGDQITLHREPCSCGCTLPVLEVRGRRDDPLRMAGQSGRLVTLLPLALSTVLEEAGVCDFQLRQQDAQTLLLQLPLQGPEGAAAVKRCRAVLKQLATVQGLKPIKLLAQLGQTMPRGRSGKAHRIVALG